MRMKLRELSFGEETQNSLRRIIASYRNFMVLAGDTNIKYEAVLCVHIASFAGHILASQSKANREMGYEWNRYTPINYVWSFMDIICPRFEFR